MDDVAGGRGTAEAVPRDGMGAEQDSQLDKLKNALIMMVDDEPIMTEMIQTFLEDAGYRNFITTDQSAQAMALLALHRPEILLLDLIMPEVSGFDILHAMRADSSLQHMPVIVLTSSTDAVTKLQALELGAADFLAKPVDPSELALRLRNTLAAKAYQDQLAYYDALTGLPNRRLFLDRFNLELTNASRDAKGVAILHIGLDRFKQINDTLGLRVGDAVLREAGQRVEQSVRVSDPSEGLGSASSWVTLSRVGGDEFAVLLPEAAHFENAAIVARRILNAMAEPVRVEGQEVFVSASIGISVFPYDGKETDTLLKHASIATYHAKEHGRNTYQFYSREINARSVERLKLENELRKALKNDELMLYYQPKVDVKTGRMTGVEALLRWNHPKLGLVMPGVFIPLAEEAGLIVRMGEWVLQEGCRQAQAWHDAGLTGLGVSVNVSPQQFCQPGLMDAIRDALHRSGLEARYLTLELTESMIMENASRNIETLHEMKGTGLKISIDDFGTGYSSLSYLKRFPLDELKVDRSFLGDLQNGADDAAIVSAIIAMAHSLNLRVVAEGVETQRQLAFLKARGCDQCQGYLFAKPMPAEELTAMVERRRQATKA